MSKKDLEGAEIEAGCASRYIKPDWILGSNVLAVAFDLRDGKPPERHVSHFIVNGGTPLDKYRDAHRSISSRFKGNLNGGIALLEISQVLEEVNEDRKRLIAFREDGLPHCGLYYLTSDDEDRNEAKATLCLLARETLMVAREVGDNRRLIRCSDSN